MPGFDFDKIEGAKDPSLKVLSDDQIKLIASKMNMDKKDPDQDKKEKSEKQKDEQKEN